MLKLDFRRKICEVIDTSFQIRACSGNPFFGNGTRTHWWTNRHRYERIWLAPGTNKCFSCSFQSNEWMVCRQPIHRRYCPYISPPVRDPQNVEDESKAVRTWKPVLKPDCYIVAEAQTLPYCTFQLHEPLLRSIVTQYCIFWGPSTKSYRHLLHYFNSVLKFESVISTFIFWHVISTSTNFCLICDNRTDCSNSSTNPLLWANYA